MAATFLAEGGLVNWAALTGAMTTTNTTSVRSESFVMWRPDRTLFASGANDDYHESIISFAPVPATVLAQAERRVMGRATGLDSWRALFRFRACTETMNRQGAAGSTLGFMGRHSTLTNAPHRLSEQFTFAAGEKRTCSDLLRTF